ncbi:MAG: hypothetical protein HYX69_06920 [Planctomycetia bacterium]|nr:hypothetical protein [Planctomycetia bacterium]
MIVTAPADWKPSTINTIPPAVLSATFYARRLPLYKALAITEAYNKARLPRSGRPNDGTWALCIVSVGQRGMLVRLARESMRARGGKGGAA